MSYDSNESALLFEAPPIDWSGEVAQAAPRKQGNPLAIAGAALSFLPPVGLVLSTLGFTRSKARRGAGRTVALVGIALSLAFCGVEAYVGATAPLFDAGCRDANPSAAKLRALQADPGGDLAAIATELDGIHVALARSAGEAVDTRARAELQLVADDVEQLSSAFGAARTTGDTSGLVTAETKLEADGAAAESYCGSW
jgi:hypothetical protein